MRFQIFCTCAPCVAPRSKWHGMYRYDYATARSHYAIVPLNVLLFLVDRLWFNLCNPMTWFQVHIRQDDAQRLRAVERELTELRHAVERHGLFWHRRQLTHVPPSVLD